MEFAKVSGRGTDKNNMQILHNAEPRKILKTVVEKQIPAIMTYVSRNKWHAARVTLTELGAAKLYINISPRKKPYPVNVQPLQSVGISLKYDYGKAVFQTKVIALELSKENKKTPVIVLAIPENIELVPRRSYFRVQIPKSLNVITKIGLPEYQNDSYKIPEKTYWQGRLIDISAGGAQIVVDRNLSKNFKHGMAITFELAQIPQTKPLTLNAQIRNIIPTANEKNMCMGLQIVGLEASPQGHKKLARLITIVEKYYNLNHT